MVETIVLVGHVAISLLAILAGFVVSYGMVANKRQDGWTAFFLATTVLTSATGYLFPFNGITPGIVIGAISLVILAVAIYARFPRRMVGVWRRVYVLSAVAAFYLNFFVLVVQAFLKVPALHDLAPTQGEPPFAIAQLVVLVAFVVLGVAAATKFRGEARGAKGD